MTDIVERLRVLADEIERIREGHWKVAAALRNQITGKDIEINILRDVLKELLDETEGLFALVNSDPHQTKTVYPRFVLKARAVLEGKE